MSTSIIFVSGLNVGRLEGNAVGLIVGIIVGAFVGILNEVTSEPNHQFVVELELSVQVNSVL